MWHQPCLHCKYTTSVDIKQTHYKNFTHVESHASTVQRKALYKSNSAEKSAI